MVERDGNKWSFVGYVDHFSGSAWKQASHDSSDLCISAFDVTGQPPNVHETGHVKLTVARVLFPEIRDALKNAGERVRITIEEL